MLINEIKGTVYETSVDSTKNIPDIDISDMGIYVKNRSNLYNHQYDFLKYAKSRADKGFIVDGNPDLRKNPELFSKLLGR